MRHVSPPNIISCLSNRLQESAYSTACYKCPEQDQCTNCTVLNGDKVQVCEPVLAHTSSPSPNGTLRSLELQKGFWRSSSTSKDIRECYEEKACVGGAFDYCAIGYTGPCKYHCRLYGHYVEETHSKATISPFSV